MHEELEAVEERIDALEDAMRACDDCLEACGSFLDVDITLSAMKSELFYQLQEARKQAKEMEDKRRKELMRAYHAMVL